MIRASVRYVDRTAAPIIVFVAAVWVTSATVSSASSRSTLISTGLRNLGNTCYLNTQLHCAYHIPRVRELITSPRRYDPPEENPADDINSESPPTDSIGLKALRQVFLEMERACRSDFPAPVSPLPLCRSLGIPVMEQQDCQEFWKLLLPALQLPQLVDLYQGSYEDYITEVGGLGRERRREEPFLDLSLEITRYGRIDTCDNSMFASGLTFAWCNNRNSLLQSLQDMFGTPELLSEKDGNGWRPEKGSPKVDALKGSLLRVAGLPSLLQFHLKRFQYDWQTDVMSKVNDCFSFPGVLDLASVCTDVTESEKESTVYDLQSVVVHVGEYGSGHYYAYVRPDIRSEEWYRFNDHEVVQVSFQEVINDSYGGRVEQKAKARRGLLSRVFGSMNGGSFGWGGQTSSAYMLQYVRRCEISELYPDEDEKQ